MKPKYLNPQPIDTKKDTELPALPETFSGQLDDDWTKYATYAKDGRLGHLKYPHLSIYKRSGALTSKPNVLYRLFDCNVADVTLSQKDNLIFMGCIVTKVSGGNKSRVTFRDSKISKIEGNTDCVIFVENCDISDLKISSNTGCQVIIQDNTGLVGFTNASRGIPSDPEAEKNGEKPGVTVGSKNVNNLSGFIGQNTKCDFQLSGITMTTGNPITQNTKCGFWLRKSKSTTGAYTFSSNTACQMRIDESTFSGNDWVVSDDTSCEYISKKNNYSNIHGFRGSKLTFFMKDDTVVQDKCFSLSDSHVSINGGTIGGAKICLMTNTQFFVSNATVAAGTFISTSTKCQFNFADCTINSGADCFIDTKCRYDLNKCESNAGTNSFLLTDSIVKLLNSTLIAGVNNFKSTGTSVTSVTSTLTAGPCNIEGQYKLLNLENTTMTAVDGFKGTVENAVIKRSQSPSGSHPLQGHIGVAEFDTCTFTNHTVLSIGKASFKDVTWAGVVDLGPVNELLEIGSTYGDVTNWTDVNGKSNTTKTAAPFTVVNSSIIEEKCEHLAPTSYSKVQYNSHTSQYAAPLDVVDSVFDAQQLTVSAPFTINTSRIETQNATIGAPFTATACDGELRRTNVAASITLSGCGSITLSQVTAPVTTIDGCGMVHLSNSNIASVTASGSGITAGLLTAGTLSLTSCGYTLSQCAIGSVTSDGGSAGAVMSGSASISAPAQTINHVGGDLSLVSGQDTSTLVGKNHLSWVVNNWHTAAMGYEYHLGVAFWKGFSPAKTHLSGGVINAGDSSIHLKKVDPPFVDPVPVPSK